MRAQVETATGILDRKARLGYCSDYVGKTFGTIFYAIDATDLVLHTIDITG